MASGCRSVRPERCDRPQERCGTDMTTTQARPPRVTYFDADRVVEVEGPEETLLGLSQRHRIPHMSECGGRARCTTCRVRCLDGVANLSPRTDAERAIAAARGWESLYAPGLPDERSWRCHRGAPDPLAR